MRSVHWRGILILNTSPNITGRPRNATNPSSRREKGQEWSTKVGNLPTTNLSRHRDSLFSPSHHSMNRTALMPPLSSASSSNHIGPASPPRFSALHIEDPLPPAVLADVQGRGMSVHVLISSYLLYEGEDAARGLLSGRLRVGLLTGGGRGRGRRVGGGAGATVRGGGRLRGQWHRRYRRD